MQLWICMLFLYIVQMKVKLLISPTLGPNSDKGENHVFLPKIVTSVDCLIKCNFQKALFLTLLITSTFFHGERKKSCLGYPRACALPCCWLIVKTWLARDLSAGERLWKQAGFIVGHVAIQNSNENEEKGRDASDSSKEWLPCHRKAFKFSSPISFLLVRCVHDSLLLHCSLCDY